MKNNKDIKILVAEDDKFISEIYFTKLSHENFNVIMANNGEEALALATKEKPDLILLDVFMPKIGGMEVLKKIRSNSELDEIKIIMLTNVNETDYLSQAEEAGANAYMVKSNYTPQEVTDKIKEVLGEKIATKKIKK